MDFRLTKEQEAFKKEFMAFCEAEIAPNAAAIDSGDVFPADNWKKLAGRGIQALMIPTEYGGQGGCLILGVTAIDVLAASCASTAMSVGTSMFCAGKTVEIHGSAELKKKILPVVAKGEAVLALAVTEPDCGSDVAAMTTTARKKDGKFILNGEKSYITNAPAADYIIVAARAEDGDGKPKFTVLVVEKGTAGMSVSPAYKTLGLRGAAAAGIKFVNCEVPTENLIGAEGDGIKIIMDSLDYARLNVSAVANGISSAAFFAAKEYSENRMAFGKPIAVHQDIAFRMADIHVEMDVARMLTYNAAWLKMQGWKCRDMIAVAKIASSETAVANTSRAVSVFGGRGFGRGTVVERLYRDAKHTEIAAGTNDILRGMIASELLND